MIYGAVRSVRLRRTLQRRAARKQDWKSRFSLHRRGPSVWRSWRPSGRALDSREVGQLFAVRANDASPVGKRCIFAAVRRRSMADGGGGAATRGLRPKQRRTGGPRQGNRRRSVFATNGAKRAIDAWVRVGAPGPPLCPVDKAGRIAIRPVTAQTMMIWLKRDIFCTRHLERTDHVPCLQVCCVTNPELLATQNTAPRIEDFFAAALVVREERDAEGCRVSPCLHAATPERGTVMSANGARPEEPRPKLHGVSRLRS